MLNKGKTRTWFEKYAPPGRNIRSGCIIYFGGLQFAFYYGWMTFMWDYRQAWYAIHLLKDKDDNWIPVEGAKMLPFAELLSGKLNMFYLLSAAMIVVIILNYAYHRQGSKSVYMMKRLPNRLEMHKRCITLPLVGVLLAIITAGVLCLLLYYGIYIRQTPVQCLPL